MIGITFTSMDKETYILPDHQGSEPVGTLRNIFENKDELRFEIDYTTHGLFSFITSHNKWYNGIGSIGQYCTQQTASALVKSYKEGRITHEKLVHLFNHFGYTLNPVSWTKIKHS